MNSVSFSSIAQRGALNLRRSSDLLRKLEHRFRELAADRSNSYAAIDAFRDAYHLREWLWHDHLEYDPALQVAIMGSAGTEAGWNAWVNQSFPDFAIVRDLCNGSKHFEAVGGVRATYRAGWDSPVSFWDNPDSGWDDNGFHVETDTGRFVAVVVLVARAHYFWKELFARFPQLAV